ncbi:MAG: effector binding domain-containing protein [Tannerellaceae bacterium]|jgi:predicted transcriptional regulator YdeE/general stress protein 26|nr:effector binding domain-containing protein [Tannerellaceae bacterium]
MELKLFHMGSVADLSPEQRIIAEAFINAQIHGVVATNNPKTGARMSNLNNMPEQTLDRLYFATDSTSAKIANIKSDARFEVLYTDGNSQLFLTGRASIVEDKDLRRAKWMDMMYEHFKDGPDGEQYCLIEFRPEETRIMLAEEAVFETVKLETIQIIGISVRTSNAAQPVTNDISTLWGRFWNEHILSKIPHKMNDDIYAVYTEYEGDANAPYTTVIGCRVSSLDTIPEGMKGVTIEGGDYAKTHVNGKLSDGIVQQGWSSVWQANLDRKYQADFEWYKCDGFDPDQAEVDIFVGLK